MGMQWRKMRYQIRVSVKEVFGVSSVCASFPLPYQQFIFCQQTKESISAYTRFMPSKNG